MESEVVKPYQGKSPSFKNPPVIEVVCGLQFASIPGWLTSHYGMFWHDVINQYPSCQDLPPLGKLQLGDFEQPDELALAILPPLRRVFLVDASQNYLMQVQQDRFLHNWRKPSESAAYPRFQAAYGRFREQWDRFNSFLKATQLPAPRIEAYELTYVNAILAPDAEFPRDIWRFLNFYKEFPLPASGLPPRVLNLKVGWPLDFGLGKLTLNVRHGKRTIEPADQVLIAELSAVGAAGHQGTEDMQSWFEAAHDAIVYTFAALTTDSAHQLWERIHE